jgi:CHAT domain-containing protein
MLAIEEIDFKHSISNLLFLISVTLLSCVFYCNSSFAESTLVSQAKTAYDKTLYLEAADLYEKAYLEAKNIHGENSPLTISTMVGLANTYSRLGRLGDALKLREQIYKSRLNIYGESGSETITAMNNLASTYQDLGRLPDALALKEKVFQMRLSSLGEGDLSTLSAMNNLAITYHSIGRLSDALELREKVLKYRRNMLGEEHVDTLRAMHNLATTYNSMGRRQEALRLRERVFKLRTEILGDEHPETISAMNNLGVSYSATGRSAEALELRERIYKIRMNKFGEKHPYTVRAMNNLASSYSALGRHSEALELDDKVFSLRTSLLGPLHPDTIKSMSNLAFDYGSLGRSAESLEFREKSFKLRNEVLGERHPETIDSVENLAKAYVALKRLTEASALSDRYIEGAEWQRSQPGLSDENRQSLFQKYAEGYRFFSALLASQGNVAKGLHIAELSKARTLLESMASQLAARSGALPVSEQESVEVLKAQIGSLSELIEQAKSPIEQQNLESSRNALVFQFEALQFKLKKQYPKYAQLSDVKIIEATDLSNLIPQASIAISYLIHDGRIGVYIVNSDGVTKYAELGKISNLADLVDALRRSNSLEGGLIDALADDGKRVWRLADGSFALLEATKEVPPGAQAVNEANQIARYFSDKLLKPLEADLKGKARWIISPDGALGQLPFDTLPWGEEGEPAIASAEIQYTQSLSVYALSKTRQAQYQSLKGRKDLFAMGNPQYLLKAVGTGQGNSQSGVQIKEQTTDQAKEQRRSLSRNAPLVVVEQLKDLDPLWNELPGTEAEIKGVATLFPNTSSTYLGPQATEQQLQLLNTKGELQNYQYLLLSAHGYLSAEHPALSSIVMGLRNRTAQADGYVTASEWPGYDLRSDLTVLSACDSGVGKVVSGEGVMGLPFALFVAGNVNTILTLWPVDDQGSAEFVRSLFAKLKSGETATQALAHTKREFIKSKQFNHPRYWAPYILVGAG